MNRKGQVFENLKMLGVGVLGLALTLAIAFVVMTTAKNQAATVQGLNPSETNMSQATYPGASIAWNATNTLTTAVAGIPTWVPLIILAVIGSILLGLVKLFR